MRGSTHFSVLPALLYCINLENRKPSAASHWYFVPPTQISGTGMMGKDVLSSVKIGGVLLVTPSGADKDLCGIREEKKRWQHFKAWDKEIF